MTPRQEEVDALLAQEALRREQRQHPVAEQSLRCRRVHEGDGYPAAVPIPATAGSQRVHVGVPSQEVSRGLHHGDHPCLKARVTDRRGHQPTHGLPSSLAQSAQQLTVVEENDWLAVNQLTVCEGQHTWRPDVVLYDSSLHPGCNGSAGGGIGGSAEVYLAEERGPGGFELRLAVKRLLPHVAEDRESVKMFLDEARIAARLQHPHIVRILDIQEHEGDYWLAMELMDGPHLGQLIRSARSRGAVVPLPVVTRIARSVLGALAFAHQATGEGDAALNVVHRDVKPRNILTNRAGEVKLADFGIARAELRLFRTRTGVVRGTPAYMAPEQRRGGPAHRKLLLRDGMC
ncbi:MAG TPA: protein kinase [Thermoanaerobaculia bacterium]|nr:protein kinase [Thermoanaerobaculia bacterium]